MKTNQKFELWLHYENSYDDDVYDGRTYLYYTQATRAEIAFNVNEEDIHEEYGFKQYHNFVLAWCPVGNQ